MTVAQALQDGTFCLLSSGVPDSRLDAEYLLAHILGKNRMELALAGRDSLSPDDFKAYKVLIDRRASREPLQYLLGSQGFMGFSFYVDERVLIPRPETEVLCEKAIAWLSDHMHLLHPRVLDLCTGSGALAVSLALSFPKAEVSAADLSHDALVVAEKNAAALGAGVTLFQGDFLCAVSGCKFDLIVCNPPYIPSAECTVLQPEVMKEPSLALDGGEDGLAFYRRLAKEGPAFLTPGGALFCEVGHDQAKSVQNLFSPGFAETDVYPDLAGIPRIVYAQMPKSS